MALTPFDGELDASPGLQPFDGRLDGEKSGLLRRGIGDTAVSLGKGVIGAGEGVVGLASLATGGLAGQLAEQAGYRPKEAKAMLDTLYSPEQQAANRAVSEAKGIGGTLSAIAQNPSVIPQSIAESLPSMLGGQALAKGGLKLAGLAGEAITPAAARLAGAAGEGAVTAGSTAEQIRQENPDGNIYAAVPAGILTAGLGVAGGKLANKMGLGDIDTALLTKANRGTASLPKRVIGGAISEGLLEEAPQSAQEQAFQNLGTGKPLMEGVPEAAALGGVVGGAMGGGFGVLHKPAAQPQQGQPAGEQAIAAQPMPDTGPISRAANASIANGVAHPAAVESAVPPATPPSGSFSNLTDFENLVNAERADLAQRRSGIAQDQQASNEARLQEINRAVEYGRLSESERQRDAVMDEVFQRPETAYASPLQLRQAFAGALSESGFTNPAPTEREAARLERALQARSAILQSERQAPPAGDFGQLAEFDNLLTSEKTGLAARRAAMQRQQANQPTGLTPEKQARLDSELAAGWKPVGKRGLVSPSGKRHLLSNPELDYLQSLKEQSNGAITATPAAQVVAQGGQAQGAQPGGGAGDGSPVHPGSGGRGTDAGASVLGVQPDMAVRDAAGGERVDATQAIQQGQQEATAVRGGSAGVLLPEGKDSGGEVVQDAAGPAVRTPAIPGQAQGQPGQLSNEASGGPPKTAAPAPTGERHGQVQEAQPQAEVLSGAGAQAPATQQALPAPGRAAPTEPWQITAADYAGEASQQYIAKRGGTVPAKAADDVGMAAVKRHARLVRDAVSQGKPVPAEVLADYPDLQQGQPNARVGSSLAGTVPAGEAGVDVPEAQSLAGQAAPPAATQGKARIGQDDQQRLTRAKDHADDLRAMSQDAGWSERGGRLLRDASGEVTGRTAWRATADWFHAGMIAQPDAVRAAVDKAVEGKRLSAKESRTVAGMVEWLEAQKQGKPLDENSSAYDFERAGYNEATPQERQAFDDAMEFLGETTMSEADAMRALGFSEEEIRESARTSEPQPGQAVVGQAQPRGPPEGAADAQEGFRLESPTAAELRAREDGLARQREQEAEAQRQAEQKAQADAERGTFTLTGSSRPADVAASQGQGGLFDQPAPQPEQPKPAPTKASEPTVEVSKANVAKADAATERAKAKFSEAMREAERSAAQERAAAQAEKDGLTEADRILRLSDHDSLIDRLRDGTATLEDYRNGWAALQKSRETLRAELAGMTKDAIFKARGAWFASRYKSDRKDVVVDAALRDMAGDFTLGRSYSFGMGKDAQQDAVSALVERTTQDDIDKFAKEVSAAREERAKRMQTLRSAVTDPQSLADFKEFIRIRGADKLTDEQRVRYEDLVALDAKEQRAAEAEKKATVQGVEAGTGMSLVETTHTRDKYSLFVVQMDSRVDADTYKSLLAAAKRLGGWYSSFKGNGAIPGFQFKDKAAAENFMAAGQGETVKTDRVEQKQEARKSAAAQRLADMADKLEASANEELSRERLANTNKRAAQASSADAKARADLAFAQTLRNLADAIETGKATHLDGVKTKSQVEALDGILRTAQADELRARYPSYADQERHKGAPATAETVKYVKFPVIEGRADQANDAIRALEESKKPGVKMLVAQLQRFANNTGSEWSELPDGLGERVLDKLKDSPSAKMIPWHWAERLANAKRLKAMGIESPIQLRATLREFIQYRGTKPAADRAKELERSLVGKNVGFDFFPTPKAVADDMVEQAGIEPGMTVLEPSAGNGNIAEAIRAAGASPDVVELSSQLREVLEAKGFKVIGQDFLQTEGQYDRIVMNPPFSNGADIEHVQHAYTLLKPGGRIVAIVGEGAFGRSDKQATAFREWLDERGATVEKLPANTFADRTLMNTTGANARLVVIDNGEAKFSFAGQNARTADKFALATALERLEAGEDAEAVRQDTGWFFGPDGRPRFEISDRDAKLKADHFPDVGKMIGQGKVVGDLLAHPRLFAAYPQLADIPVTTQPGTGASIATPKVGGPSIIKIGEDVPMGKVVSTLLHEIQHAVQRQEGFAIGSNLQSAGSREAYFRSAGEVEARNVQTRQKMTDEERRGLSPFWTTDVADQDVIVQWNGKEVANAQAIANGPHAGMALRDVQAVVDRVARGLKNLPRVHVLESPAALSTKDPAQKALRDQIRAHGAWADVEGATHDGEIYLFASGLANEARAEHVLATHEITHYGLRGAIGKDLDVALQTVWMSNPSVRQAAAALKERIGLGANLAAVEEVLADMGPADLAKLSGWRAVVKAVRDWFSRIGAKALAARLDKLMKAGLSGQRKADLFVADLVTAAREWVRSGKGPAVFAEGTRLSGIPEQRQPVLNRTLLAWAGKVASRDRSAPLVPVTGIVERPVSALRLAGIADPIVMDIEHARHVLNTHPEIRPEDIAALPDLLSRPRAIMRHGNGWRVIADARDPSGYPLAVALTRSTLGGVKKVRVTEVSTLFGVKNSASAIVRGVKDGSLIWMPQKEIGRLLGLLSQATNQKLQELPSGPQLPLQDGKPRPPTRLNSDRTYFVLSDESRVNFERDPKGDWRTRTVAITLPEDAAARLGGTQFSRAGQAAQAVGGLFGGEAVVGNSGRPYTPEQEAFFRNTGRTVTKPTLQERMQALWKDAGKKLAQGLVDQFAPIKDLSDKAYMLARLSKGATGAFEALLHHGKLSLKDGVYDADQSGGAVQTVFMPLQGEGEDFLWWMAANRAERLSKEDRERLFTPQDIAAGKSLADGQLSFDYTLKTGHLGHKAGEVTRSRKLAYQDSLKTFEGFNRNVMDMAEQSGLIDGAARKLWEHEFYVPFYRVSDDGDGFRGANIKSSLVRQEAFKQLKGGSDKLNADLLANTLKNWAHLIDASAKNRAAKETLDAAVKMGAARPALPGEKKTVWYNDGGRKAEFKVEDPYLMTAISSLEYAGLRGPMMDAMSTFKHVLTIGVTASPFFKIRNLIRDSISAIGVSELGANPLTNIREGIKASDRSNQTHVSMLASGGLIRFGTMLEGKESDRVRQLVKAGVKDSTILNTESKVRQMYDKYIDPAISAYNELGNRGEEINRAALYQQLRDKGMDHATASFMARDLMDFSMQGAWSSVRLLTQVVPFMNARLQGLYKLGRGAKENPRKFGAVLGSVALASIMLMLAYQDDDDWKKREDWDRDNYWWFKLGGEAFRIPKPFEIGAIGTLAERGLEFMISDEMTGKRLADRFLALLGDNLSMNPVPQLVKPILDVYANKDSFTGRPIETLGMDRLAPEYRYTTNTSLAARALSAAGNAVTGVVGKDFLSPVQIDQMIRGYFGWLGTFVVGSADRMVRPLTEEPATPAVDYWKLATGGMVQSLEGAGSRYVSQLYQQAKIVEEAYATHRQLLKDGRVEEAQDYFDDNREEISGYRRIEAMKRQESQINARIRQIEKSDMPAAQKREEINALRARQDRTARLAPAAGFGNGAGGGNVDDEAE
jgi:predicted RNA methylase